MKILLIILSALIIQIKGSAQSRLENAGSPDFVLYNTNALNTGETSRLLFKNGNYYDGGIATIGTSATAARMAFFTQTVPDMNNMLERMTISNTGYIGIANNNPQYPLHLKSLGIGFTQESISGDAKVGFYTNASSAYLQTHNNIPLYFATNNASAQMTLSTTGRLGIGTTTPATKLDVKGKTTITQQPGEDAALELNGSLKVSGTYPMAFVVTSTLPDKIVIDHPVTNGNPEAMILVTNRIENPWAYSEGTIAVIYDNVLQKWTIVPTGARIATIYANLDLKTCNDYCQQNLNIPNMVNNAFISGTKFNVLVIDK
jgi:hypothetical protein